MSFPAVGDPVSVVWGTGSRQPEVRRATVIANVEPLASDVALSLGQRSLLIHYRLHYDPPRPTTYNDGVELISAEGSRWCCGWEGPQVDALRTVMLLGG